MSPSNQKGFWIGVAILFAFGVARVLTMEASPREGVMGKKAPPFELPSVAGETVSLADHAGKVIVLDFWAVWCGPCRESMPFFQMLSDKYGEEGLSVIGVHVDDRVPSAEKVGDYLADLGVSYTNVLSTVETDDAFMIYAMPTTYILDRDGVIQKRHIGFDPGTAPAELEEQVREMLELD